MNMKSLIFCFFTLTLNSAIISQTLVFESIYGDNQNDEVLFSTINTRNDEFYSIGYSKNINSGYSDMLVCKFDKNGTLIWKNTYGGSLNDSGIDITELENGNFLLVGSTRNYIPNASDIWISEIDPEGIMVKSFVYGSIAEEYPRDVYINPDGSIHLLGYADNGGDKDLFLLQLNTDYSIINYNRLHDSSSDVEGWSIDKGIDGGYIGCGWKKSQNLADFYVVKFSDSGVVEWEQTYGGFDSDSGLAIKKDNNNYIISGTTRSFGSGPSDFWVVKIDEFGREIWNKTFGSIGDDSARGLDVTPNGYVVSGFSTGYNHDISLYFIDFDRNVQSNYTYGLQQIDEGWRVNYKNGYATVNGFITDSTVQGFLAVFSIDPSSSEPILSLKAESIVFPNPCHDYIQILNSGDLSNQLKVTSEDAKQYIIQKNADGTWDTSKIPSYTTYFINDLGIKIIKI